MNWKSVILGALVTIFVTIVGGIGVYYFTKEDKLKEDLQYTLEPTVDFTVSDSSVLIQNLQLVNKGTASSENIIFIIQANINETIVNKSISFSSGNAAKYSVKFNEKQKLQIEIENLLPNEKVKVTLLIKSLTKLFKPTITVRSKSSLGIETAWDAGIKEKTHLETINDYLTFLLPLIMLIQLVLILPTLISRIRRSRQTSPLNDSAFLLLHKNQVQEAHQILTKTLKEKGGDSHILSNYALSLSKKGTFDKAYKFIEAAEYFASGDHQNAVVNFNKGLIQLLDNKVNEGKINIDLAITQSKKEISKYIKFSDIVKDLRKDPNIDSIFK